MIRVLLAALIFLAVAVAYGSLSDEKEVTLPPPPLVDTLAGIFDEVRQAALDNDAKKFLSMLDPVQADDLERLSQRNGFKSLRTYLETQFVNWPDIDTMTYGNLVTWNEYARLHYTGGGTRIGHRTKKTRYTCFLFRRHDSGWKLEAMTALEKDSYDPYGWAIVLHETDLPPKLRFPRLF